MKMGVDIDTDNLTYDDFHDTKDGVVLARNWLGSGCTSVKLFDIINSCLIQNFRICFIRSLSEQMILSVTIHSLGERVAYNPKIHNRNDRAIFC